MTVNEYLYTGEFFDSHTGFYYLRARSMNPQVGRFVTMDPFAGIIRDPYSLHKYLYAHASPVNNLDPSGHMTVNEQMATVGIIGAMSGWAIYHFTTAPSERTLLGYTVWSIGGALVGTVVGYLMWVPPAVAATTGGIAGFTATEVGIIYEAGTILQSPQMKAIINAYKTGTPITVNIGGRLIQYEPNLPYSGMTMFGENGFILGRYAFSSPTELAKTLLHELYRLSTSASANGVTTSLAAQETRAAWEFAEKAIKVLFQ